jgi:hypothetical protein
MMIKPILTLLIVSGLCGTIFGTNTAQAADVKVTWTEPSKYRDIYSGNQGKKRFRESTFKELKKHLLKLAKVLPESQTLEIEVTDVDLAGDVHAGGMHDIRVIKEIYFPRIKFSYKLINEEQAIIHSGNVNIKDMNFMMGNNSRYRNKSLGYEKKLLDDWFKDEFVDFVMQ